MFFVTTHYSSLIHKAMDCSKPNNYKTIMIGHTFAKLYATLLDIMLLYNLECRGYKRQGEADFRRDFQITNHILTLGVIIKEACQRHFKVIYYFVDFIKAFDIVL